MVVVGDDDDDCWGSGGYLCVHVDIIHRSSFSGEDAIETPTIDVSSKEFYGEGWNPKTSLWDLLESTLTYQHTTYAEAIKQVIAKPSAN
ncbi:hypothetical protein E3N88_16372 [Mikania micrantha]|uniref:Uncharacterized protein n=1 Tax=Mikania micrantha TaxID=192012 RepID=A0A5N6NYM4_9ASTR|nr:hypothetical protein E3N88_16372 [Mikania micrantha]